ncbi:MAG: hypothetical protein AAF734_00030 [Bacteroidota bacterium]
MKIYSRRSTAFCEPPANGARVTDREYEAKLCASISEVKYGGWLGRKRQRTTRRWSAA